MENSFEAKTTAIVNEHDTNTILSDTGAYQSTYQYTTLLGRPDEIRDFALSLP
jgi:hypothetical protein